LFSLETYVFHGGGAGGGVGLGEGVGVRLGVGLELRMGLSVGLADGGIETDGETLRSTDGLATATSSEGLEDGDGVVELSQATTTIASATTSIWPRRKRDITWILSGTPGASERHVWAGC
jgi:hypothetical protein